MTDISNTRATASLGLRAFFQRLVASISAWNDARLTRKALSQLSDRQLEDIGLTRGDIDRLLL